MDGSGLKGTSGIDTGKIIGRYVGGRKNFNGGNYHIWDKVGEMDLCIFL